MNLSLNGLHFLENSESLRLEPYCDKCGDPIKDLKSLCSGGYATIGYGHKLHPGEWWQRITKEDAERLLRNDIAIAVGAVNDTRAFLLNQNQFDALVAFVFNIGTGAWSTSTCRALLKSGRYQDVPREMARWVHDKHGHVIHGLENRRRNEITLFKTPV